MPERLLATHSIGIAAQYFGNLLSSQFSSADITAMPSKPSPTPPFGGTALFRQFQEAFETITGLSLDILAPGEFRVPERAPDFCQTIGLTPKSCEACCDMHASLQDTESGNSKTADCFAGMTSSSVPVQFQGKTIAFLHTGHVFVGKEADHNWTVLRQFLEHQGLNTNICQRALNQVQVTDPKHYKSAIRLLEIFARQLSEILPASATTMSHYPAVEQAVRLLREDIEKDWTLADMARVVNMNASYLSEMFRKTTGQTFTAYLAGLRVDKARKLLLSTRLNISEVAFASGFRSISQFNRVFKNYEAKTPGNFRMQFGRMA